MKIIPLLTAFSVFFLQSCQSEYKERMANAISLKKEYLMLEKSTSNASISNIEERKELIKSEIEFQAKLSGNETHFMNSVWTK